MINERVDNEAGLAINQLDLTNLVVQKIASRAGYTGKCSLVRTFQASSHGIGTTNALKVDSIVIEGRQALARSHVLVKLHIVYNHSDPI